VSNEESLEEKVEEILSIFETVHALAGKFPEQTFGIDGTEVIVKLVDPALILLTLL
jgi:hypothetical protein